MDLTSSPAAHAPSETNAAERQAQLIEMSARMERVREEERAMLARELHDDIGGTLTALKLTIARLRSHAGNAPIKPELDEMSALLDGAAVSTQRIIRALRPGILDQGLVAALRFEAAEFQRRNGVVCNFHSNRERLDVPKGQGVAVYRVCQEALTNVAKHAQATVVEIQLHRDGDGLSLEVIDNGRGFEASRAGGPDTFGLLGMRERAKSYGGWVQIDSTVGRGTTVMLSVPLRRAQDIRP